MMPCELAHSLVVLDVQVYNIDKRIQEDNLQHLALFSEYGRMALDGTEEEKKIKKKNKKEQQEKQEKQEQDRVDGREEIAGKEGGVSVDDDGAELEEKSDDKASEVGLTQCVCVGGNEPVPSASGRHTCSRCTGVFFLLSSRGSMFCSVMRILILTDSIVPPLQVAPPPRPADTSNLQQTHSSERSHVAGRCISFPLMRSMTDVLWSSGCDSFMAESREELSGDGVLTDVCLGGGG